MPSGGIEPFNRSDEPKKNVMTIKDKLDPGRGGCWICHHGGAFHMLHEWDAWIHARCAVTYLHYGVHPRTIDDPRASVTHQLQDPESLQASPCEMGTCDCKPIHPMDEEAQIIIDNGYTVVLDFSLEGAP